MKVQLDAVIDAAILEQRIVGGVTLVAQAGQLIYHRAAGWADREARVPMREDAIFRLASLTKSIVTAATLLLIEQDVMGLDDPVTEYLPGFRPALPNSDMATITIHHLLTHTAGLAYCRGHLHDDDPYRKANVSNGMDQPGLSLTENLRRIASVPLLYLPGEGYSYSVATDVLGAAVMSATGDTLARIVTTQVTGPLGMDDTGFVLAAPERLTAAYAFTNGQPERMRETHAVVETEDTICLSPNRIFDSTLFPSGGAGMVGTAPDFMRFLETMRKGGAPILSQASVAAMVSNVIDDKGLAELGPGIGFGYSVAVVTDQNLAATPQPVGTWHWGGAYGHSWFVDPINDIVMLSLTNTTPAGMTGIYPNALRDAVYASL